MADNPLNQTDFKSSEEQKAAGHGALANSHGGSSGITVDGKPASSIIQSASHECTPNSFQSGPRPTGSGAGAFQLTRSTEMGSLPAQYHGYDSKPTSGTDFGQQQRELSGASTHGGLQDGSSSGNISFSQGGSRDSTSSIDRHSQSGFQSSGTKTQSFYQPYLNEGPFTPFAPDSEKFPRPGPNSSTTHDTFSETGLKYISPYSATGFETTSDYTSQQRPSRTESNPNSDKHSNQGGCEPITRPGDHEQVVQQHGNRPPTAAEKKFSQSDFQAGRGIASVEGNLVSGPGDHVQAVLQQGDMQLTEAGKEFSQSDIQAGGGIAPRKGSPASAPVPYEPDVQQHGSRQPTEVEQKSNQSGFEVRASGKRRRIE